MNLLFYTNPFQLSILEVGGKCRVWTETEYSKDPFNQNIPISINLEKHKIESIESEPGYYRLIKR